MSPSLFKPAIACPIVEDSAVMASGAAAPAEIQDVGSRGAEWEQVRTSPR